jgi:hypothetical protein
MAGVPDPARKMGLVRVEAISHPTRYSRAQRQEAYWVAYWLKQAGYPRFVLCTQPDSDGS